MDVREIAKRRAVVCAPYNTLAEAATRMSEHDVGSILVVDETGIVGIATDRDIVVRAVAYGLGPDAPIKTVMTPDVHVIDEEADVFTAATKMAAHGIRRLPVLDAENEVIGVVAFDDLILLLSRQLGTLTDAVHLRPQERR